MKTIKLVPVLAILLAAISVSGSGAALDRQPNGYFRTGDTVVRHKVILVTLDVLAIAHEMKALPASKSKEAVIEMDVGKRFILEMRRDVPADKMRDGLAHAYAKNGYADEVKVAQHLRALQGELKEKQTLIISYDAEKKVTTLSVRGGATTTVPGVDFMKATWRVWIGGEDTAVGDALIKRLPG